MEHGIWIRISWNNLDAFNSLDVAWSKSMASLPTFLESLKWDLFTTDIYRVADFVLEVIKFNVYSTIYLHMW